LSIISSCTITCLHWCHSINVFTGLQNEPHHIHSWVESDHQNKVLVDVHHVVHQPVFHLTNSDSLCPFINLVSSAAGRHSNMTGKFMDFKSSTCVQPHTSFILSHRCYVLVFADRWGIKRDDTWRISTHIGSSQWPSECCSMLWIKSVVWWIISFIQTAEEWNWPSENWYVWNGL
jgi:hypothetical protein